MLNIKALSFFSNHNYWFFQIIIFGVLINSFETNAQTHSCNGTVFDADTRRPLAFVNIVINDQNIGTATDIDGRFYISSAEPIMQLRLSYVGYEPKIIPVEDHCDDLTITLRPSSVELQEVVIVAGENPAHRIIRNVIENRERNDHENLQSFSYTSYDRMIFTVDTLDLPTDELTPPDSGEIRLREFLKEKDFFLMETVSERKFMSPDRNHERVLATRISGFRDPVFLFLSSQLQSTSFYKELIRISGNTYINPISRGSLRRYSFIIQDTTYTARHDTVFIISFRPRPNTNFDGLKGVLSINSNGWAIQNVIAEPAEERREDGVSIRIQQMYELIDDEHWFPVQLNTDIIFNNVRVNNTVPVGQGKSYIRDIVLNPELVRRQFNQISIEMDPMAGERDDEFWYEYRGRELTDREKATYHFIDSIGQEANLDRIASTIRSLFNSRLPWGKIDIDLSKILNYNEYEGLYLGLGLLTNRKFSETVELSGFWGYGFRDKSAKYGGNIGITLDRFREINLRLGYYDHVTETGGVHFFDDKQNVFNPSTFRNLFIERMDKSQRIEAGISFRALRYATLNFGLSKENKQPTDDYKFDAIGGNQNEPLLTDDFNFTEVSAGFRFAYKERFLQMPATRVSLGTDYPVIWFNYTRGMENFLDGAYNYNKFDLRIESKLYLKYLGESTLNVHAGYVDSPIPVSNLYNGKAAYRTFAIYARDAFLTQRMNEFISDRYIFAFYTHNFGRLLFRSEKFSPEFAVATNVGIGDLSNPERHHNSDFTAMNQLYCESGLMINRLINFPGFYTLGAGVFYRYGYYHLPRMSDNFTYRITVLFKF